MSRPYIELPDVLDLLPNPNDTDATVPSEASTEGHSLTDLAGRNLTQGPYELVEGFYNDGALTPALTVMYQVPFKISLDLEEVTFNEVDELRWEILKDGEVIHDFSGSPNPTFRLNEMISSLPMNIAAVFEIRAVIEVNRNASGSPSTDDQQFSVFDAPQPPLVISAIPEPDDATIITGTPVWEPFVAKITAVNESNLEIDTSYQELMEKITPLSEEEGTTSPLGTFSNWTVSHKLNDRKDLNTYLHFGDDKRMLVTNVKTDNKTVPSLPYSVIYKTYEPLPDDISEKDYVYVVREVLPTLTETVELVGYAQEDEDFQVLIPKESFPEESTVTKRSTEFKTYNDLVTTDPRLKDEIEDKFLKETPVELSVDYSQYENFINFSSAQKRLKNFKYKIEQIEENTAKSASFVGVTNGALDLKIHHNKIRDIKNNFDGYEKYLYNTKSTYVSSSIGIFHDASWPKTGSGTYEDPYKPVSSSHSDFTTWYGSIGNKTGQIYSASFYDQENGNRLVNLLPDHVKSDTQNSQFLDFMDMMGQQFDELWTYIKSMSDISDRRLDLEDGFSKDLIFNLAKSLGWDMQDGKDLLDLSQYGFGRKLSGSTYSLYTSGSLSSPNEADVSKEITKRLIASMPFILKSKGTEASLKAILNCYGIPSTILKVREYGGLDKNVKRTPFETKRRFTRALGFRSGQYVSSSWADDSTTSRKPETVEMRFRSVSGSDQVLIQKDDDWAIKLKDNGSDDNYGTVSFILSGSVGQKEVSSSLLPIFDGDYYSLMLKKEKIDLELFKYPSFETTALFNPPFVTGSIHAAVWGNIKIVSSSGVARTGTKSLRHENTAPSEFSPISYTKGYQTGSEPASVASVTQGEVYTFSAYAKASGSTVDSVGRLRIFELDSNEEVVNTDEDVNSSQTSITALGGVKTSAHIGLVEDEWKNISVTKTIRFPNATKLGISFENMKQGSTIFWDDVSLRKVPTNTDSILDPFSYQLFVKKYESGLDRIIHSSNTSLVITGSNASTSSYNAAWTGSGDLYIGGKASSVFGNQLTGSVMEFRTWSEPLKEQFFDNHVNDPKSYVGNSPSSSYHNLITRYSFDDNTTLSNGDTIRDISSNQTTTTPGSAYGFSGLNTFESVVDSTKTMVPNYGPNRRTSDKIRIENNFLSGSGVNLSVNKRFDFSTNDFSPVDSAKVGIYFSPTDVVNDDIISSFANLDFNQYLGDPRDNFKLQYGELKNVSDKYFQKYSDNNDFWDYMHLIRYYDQSVFKNIKKLIPMRAKPILGTVVEPNIFERSKNPVQRNNPSFERIDYGGESINISNINYNDDNNIESSHSIIKIETEYPNYDGTIDKTQRSFEFPALYSLAANDNYSDRNLYISGSVTHGGPNSIFSEPTGAMVLNQRLSVNNREYKFFYSNELSWSRSDLYSINKFENLYNSRSLHDSDLDPEYQYITAWNRSFYEGVKNTSETTLDGDLPFIITSTAPTVAVPTTHGIGKMTIDQKSGNKTILKDTPK